jgi:23S rRNA pseudouridine2605 synthase
MVQLGLLRGGDDDDSQAERQPLSHASALPPGFGTPGQNGQNGARLNRRGRVAGGRKGGIDPFTPGLLISGGLANGHPDGKDGNRQPRQGAKSGGQGARAGRKPSRSQSCGFQAQDGQPERQPGSHAPARPGKSGPRSGKPAGKPSGKPARAGHKPGNGKPGKQTQTGAVPAPADGANASAPAQAPKTQKSGRKPGGKPAGNKPRKQGEPRKQGGGGAGGERQPRGAHAHESRLGFLGRSR